MNVNEANALKVKQVKQILNNRLVTDKLTLIAAVVGEDSKRSPAGEGNKRILADEAKRLRDVSRGIGTQYTFTNKISKEDKRLVRAGYLVIQYPTKGYNAGHAIARLTVVGRRALKAFELYNGTAL